jgi:hypothetical protein
MKSMTDTALILGLAGIGGTVAAGTLTPWVAAHFASEHQRRAFEQERTMRDEEELRTVLDGVAASIEDCDAAMHNADVLVLRWGRMLGQQDVTQDLTTMRTADRELRALTGRLAIRLGRQHPVRRAAVSALSGYSSVLRAIYLIAFMAADVELTKARLEMEEGRRQFDEARTAFVELATAYAGSRLPRRPHLEIGLPETGLEPEGRSG